MGSIDKLDQGKFIVINQKRFAELNAKHFGNYFCQHPSVDRLETEIKNFVFDYETETGKKMNHRYIVCNQDEPYAEEVARIILEGEAKKARS